MSEQRSRTSDPHKSPYEKAVFVSYAWGGESERTVDELELAFHKRGIRIVRDKKDLDYKGSIETFEQRIAQGQCVILVISDKYLRSEHCMYELLEVDEKRSLRERIFPIVLADARIYKAVDRLKYIKLWDTKIQELDQAIRQSKGVMTGLESIMADLSKYRRIRDSFDRLTDLLSDMNTLTPNKHKQGDYQILVDAVERKLFDYPGHLVLPISSGIDETKEELAETPVEAPPANPVSGSRRLWRNRWNLSPAVFATVLVGILGAAATIIAAFIEIGPQIIALFQSTPVPASPTPFCMSSEDILVKVHVLRSNNTEITTLTPRATFYIEPGLTVYFDVELISVNGIDLPSPECSWKNTGSATDGRLLHNAGCRIDYQGGLENITDSISLQLSQPSCSALPPYAFFISPQ